MTAFYVYAHFRASTGALFYIGKGSGRRAWSRSSRNKWWRSVADKHGVRVRIIKSGLAEADAYEIEERLIAHRRGSLTTFTGGGRGASGYRHTEAARRAMSEKRKGRELSTATKARLSDAIRSRPDLLALRSEMFAGDRNPAKKPRNRLGSSIRMTVSNPMSNPVSRAKAKASLSGRKTPVETRKKISDALRGRKTGPVKPHVAAVLAVVREKRKRPVKTACGMTFGSTAEAARATGARQGNIVNNCAGRSKSAGGFVWSYADEPLE